MTLDSKLALDYAGDANPASQPQAESDRQHVNDSYRSDDERYFDESPETEYKFFWANGDLDVSGEDEHDSLRERMNVSPDHSGPTAVGNVTVQDGVAIWEVTSNVALSAIVKSLKKYTTQAGWAWGGIVDPQGNPLGNDEKLARVQLKDHDTGAVHNIVVYDGRIARTKQITPAIREWAYDNLIHVAEYPGGSNMMDQLKNNSPAGEDYEIKNIYDPDPQERNMKDRDKTPIGTFKCPDCAQIFGRWNEYITHRQTELPPAAPTEDGKFPEINDANYHEWDGGEPGFTTGRVADTAPKDMFKDPIPFIYDIEEDAIFVGNPGGRSSEIEVPSKFTPGGIAEGEYQPGGKVLMKSRSDTPYSVRHMLNLWYYSHPEFEITGVELTGPDGDTHKVAHASVGAFIVGLAAQDPAAHGAWLALKKAGGTVYVVGGAVRDALMNKKPKDIDLMVTGVPADEVGKVLSALPGRMDLTGKDFGVYRYNVDDHEVEIALPRTERSTGGRRVDFEVSVDHTLPIHTDLERRDFTANAIAVNLDTGAMVDPFNGEGDIADRNLQTVHPNSFVEDPTRLVRALVAHARHGLEPTPDTRRQMQAHGDSLMGESPERIQAELDKLMKSDNPAKAVRLAHDTGLLQHILPEVDACFDYDQNNPHHNYDLGTHLLNVLEHTAENTKDPDVRLAALLHDIGKPSSQWTNPETGGSHYYYNAELGMGKDHELEGADMAESRMKALKYPNSRIKRVKGIIAGHMFPDFSSEKGGRKFLNRYGEHADELFTIREADRAGKGTDEYQDTKTPVQHQREIVEAIKAKGQATTQSNLAVNGNDLIGMGIQPGPMLGELLKALTDLVVETPEMNEKHTLLNYVRHNLTA